MCVSVCVSPSVFCLSQACMSTCISVCIKNHSQSLSTILTDLESLSHAQSSLMGVFSDPHSGPHVGMARAFLTGPPAQPGSRVLLSYVQCSLSLPPTFTLRSPALPAPFLCPATWAGYRTEFPASILSSTNPSSSEAPGARRLRSHKRTPLLPSGSHHPPSFLLPGFE